LERSRDLSAQLLRREALASVHGEIVGAAHDAA
jgi:hypothetical protein